MNETERTEMNTMTVSKADTDERPETANMSRIDYLTLLEELDHR